jgi:membrane-associated phospholipid phosphatase
MRAFWDNPWFNIPVLIFFMMGIAVMSRFAYGAEIIALNGLREEPLNTFFRYWTRLAEVPAFVVAALLALFWHYRLGLLIVVAGLLTLGAQFGLKEYFQTARPLTFFEKAATLRERVVFVPGEPLHSGGTSFPSGHTMGGFALYGLLALAAGPKRPFISFLCAWTAILVGVSRIFLVQHFMSDVLGGALCGLAISWVVWWINDQIPTHKPSINPI